MILIDSHIPIYLIGAARPHKSDAQRRLERLINDRERLVTDADVLQDILHRYVAIQRLDAIQPAFDAMLKLVDEVIAIDRKVAERAKQIFLAYRHLSARDAVHVAVMEQYGITRILSFDTGFDNLPGVTRIC